MVYLKGELNKISKKIPPADYIITIFFSFFNL